MRKIILYRLGYFLLFSLRREILWYFSSTFRGRFTKRAPKIKSNYIRFKEFQSEEFICNKKNSVHVSHLWKSVTYLVSLHLAQIKLNHTECRELNILTTKFCCALWKNVLLKKFISQLVLARKAKDKAQELGILRVPEETRTGWLN